MTSNATRIVCSAGQDDNVYMYVVLAHIHVDIVGDCRQFPGDSQSPETANTMYPPSMLCHRASGGYQERIMRASLGASSPGSTGEGGAWGRG